MSNRVSRLELSRLQIGQIGHAMGVQPNSLRYAAPKGTVLLRWDGARQPVVWTAPARIELARRYLHIFGPATAASLPLPGLDGAIAVRWN
jgi:hypothetical protein